MEKFNGKYRTGSHRMPRWDYSGEGFYFVTLVTGNRFSFFGKIENNRMIVNDLGKIVIDEWNKSFKIRTELFYYEFVLMPNHLHAIVAIKKSFPLTGIGHEMKNATYQNDFYDHILHGNELPDNELQIVETHGRVSQQSIEQYNKQNDKQPRNTDYSYLIRKPKSLSSFIAGFKSSVTSRINNYLDREGHNYKFNRKHRLWQPNFYDHIIRNRNEYRRIAWYIRNNPARWHNDYFI